MHGRALAFTSPHPLPVSSSRPLAPPGSLKEIHCPCFLSCLPLPELGKQYSTKESEQTSCPFVHRAGQRCCLLHSPAWFLSLRTGTLFDGRKKNSKALFVQCYNCLCTCKCAVAVQVFLSYPKAKEKRWKCVCEVVEFRFRSWGTFGSLCISIRPYFSQTAKAACILSQPVFDQLPVASQYVGKISSEVFKWVTFGLKDAWSCAHTHTTGESWLLCFISETMNLPHFSGKVFVCASCFLLLNYYKSSAENFFEICTQSYFYS